MRSTFKLLTSDIKLFPAYSNYFELLYYLSKDCNIFYLDCLIINVNETVFYISKEFEAEQLKKLVKEIIYLICKIINDFIPAELNENELFECLEKEELPINLDKIVCNYFKNINIVSFKCKIIVNLKKMLLFIICNIELERDILEYIIKPVEKGIDLAIKFDSKPLFRYILWKKGYFSQQNSIPSLYAFESIAFLILFYEKKLNIKKEINLFFSTIKNVLYRFLYYLKDIDILQEDSESDNKIFLIDEEINRDFFKKAFLDKKNALILYSEVINEHFIKFLDQLEKEYFNQLACDQEFNEMVIDLVLVSNRLFCASIKCKKCTDCRKCLNFPNFKEVIDNLERLLKRIYSFLRENIVI